MNETVHPAPKKVEKRNPSVAQIIVSLFVAVVLGACAPLSPTQLPQTDQPEVTSDVIYKELHGIDRDLHRAIRRTEGKRRSGVTLEQVKAKHDLSPREDSCPVFFGQPSINAKFSAVGTFYRLALDDVVAELKSGRLKADDVPLRFIWVDGKRVTLNNRSLTVLYKAGMRPTNLIDRTGNLPAHGTDSVEEVLQRLDAMGGKPSTEMLVRTPGVGADGQLKEASDWDAPLGEIVVMPDDLLMEARTCTQKANNAQ
jgi:hypothetical protein